LKQTSLQADSLAKTSASQEIGRGLQENEADCSGNWQSILSELNHAGLSSKMFPGFSLREMEKICTVSSVRWTKSGIVWRGECLMLNTSEWLNGVKECGLSEVLETQVPSKYYLSENAVRGMIARSTKWARGGYVLLQERVSDTTQRLKRMSLQQLEQLLEETPGSYGKTLILRKLTPKEKERLMGFPEGWTACVGKY